MFYTADNGNPTGHLSNENDAKTMKKKKKKINETI